MARVVEVVVVGAGLAGLRCCEVLNRNGIEVVLLEAAPKVGGRLASHLIDGYLIDQGFQLINPGYPELRASGVLADFDLRSFPSAVMIATEEGLLSLPDPRRAPFGSLRGLRRLGCTTSDLVRIGRLLVHLARGDGSQLREDEECSTEEGLLRLGISTAAHERLLAPFLRGTLLDDELLPSWRYSEMLLRSFMRGRPGTHPEGVAALPAAMAARLGHTTIVTGSPARRITATQVHTDHEHYRARAVVVATDPDAATRLLGTAAYPWRAQTTWWYSLPTLRDSAALRLLPGDDPIASALDLTSVAPERAPDGRALVAAAKNGLHPGGPSEQAARVSVARLYSADLADVTPITTSLVARALPERGELLGKRTRPIDGAPILAGDYLTTPSIQGALVSGRHAAVAALRRLGR